MPSLPKEPIQYGEQTGIFSPDFFTLNSMVGTSASNKGCQDYVVASGSQRGAEMRRGLC